MISDLLREPPRVPTGSLSWIVRSPFVDLWSWVVQREQSRDRWTGDGRWPMTLTAVKRIGIP